MKLRKWLIGFCFLVPSLILISLLFRSTILQWAFARMQTRAKETYHVHVEVSSIRFAGFDNIVLENLSLRPENADTLLMISRAELNLSLLDLIKGRAGFDEVRMNSVHLTIYNDSARNNISFLKYLRTKNLEKKREPKNYREMAIDMSGKLFRVLHTAFAVREISLRYEDSSHRENIYVPEIKYDLQQFSGLMINRKAKDTIVLSGNVLARNKSYQFYAKHASDENQYLPFLDNEHSLQCRFKTLSAKLDFEKESSAFKIRADINTEDFHINHWRLAKEEVSVSKGLFKGLLNISDDAVELDSASQCVLNTISCNLYANYYLKPSPVFSLKIKMPETNSDSFFHSLPRGMFHTLKGISCTGTLIYDLLFSINTQQPDSMTFISSLKRKNFQINHYGEGNYARINNPFTYDAFDKDRFVRSIIIGAENPMFTPLAQINPYLVKSVLQSEDPSFMLHRGFLPEAFRESVVKNYKERRFARGGSTISMQLVKNVFLSRDKTVSRKVEEALIVYLIENLGLVSKERMLEIYLNVIEWGPNVYGIHEAARFYFNKKPSELSLQESIFLAGIIPNPKFFKYQFDKDGKLKSYLSSYFKILTGRMASKGWILPTDTSSLLPDVKLKGAALKFILPNDTIETPEENEMILPD